MSLTKIFAVNLGLGLLASVVHIGVLVLYLKGVPGVSITSLYQLGTFIGLEIVVVISAILALMRREVWQKRALTIHGAIFGVVAALTLFSLLHLLTFGLSGSNFVVTLGFSTALVGYGASVAGRAFYRGENKHIHNIGWYAAGMTFLLELLLMYRLYADIRT